MRACGQGRPWSLTGALICRQDPFVVYEQVVVGSLVVRGVLRSLCVWLGTVLHLCVRTLDGGELHVAYCSTCVGALSARTG